MKLKDKNSFLVWVLLVAITVLAVMSFIGRGQDYIAKDYFEQSNFSYEVDEFVRNLVTTVLNPIDIETEKAKITVTNDEIEDHRTYYGSLADQIGSIEEQYKERIVEAKAGTNEKFTAALIEERDTKIEDIRKNFESDTHIEKKLRAVKERELVADWNRMKRDQNQQNDLRLAYKLKDIKTGELFELGNVDESSAYERHFYDQNVLVAKQEPLYGDDYYYEVSDAVYSESTTSTESSDASQQSQEVRKFEGMITLPQSAVAKDQLGMQIKAFNLMKYSLYVLWFVGVLSAIALGTIFRFEKHWVLTNRYVGMYDSLKIDLKVALLIFSGFVGSLLLDMILSSISVDFFLRGTEKWFELGLLFVLFCLFIWITAIQLVLLVERLKKEGTLVKDIQRSYSAKFPTLLREMFLNRTIGKQMLILLFGFFLAGVGFAGMLVAPFLAVVYIPLVLFIALPLLYIYVRRTAYLNKILLATKEMAEGRLQREIPIEGKSPLAKHAVNLNNLREGVRTSMTQQAKSERLKTELITNVSHDLRTPLTSIITYTDLLKNPELPEEERIKYVGILDKKSQRLKTLIEDLFEVSKMASGNLELNRERVDLTQLLQQALAEHAEQIEGSGVDFRTAIPEHAMIATVDGQKWWRLLDNLILNAIKYTLPGTRVYITLRQVGTTAEFVVKNVSKYEIDENVDELFERFKRADTSRHTEGSGLGLAIAQSIVDLHQGTMGIEIDGDLFKVTVTVPMS